MRKLFRTLLLLLSVALLVCALGCSDGKDDNLDEFEQLLLSTEGEADNSAPFASTVYVIMPENCSAELSERAKRLAENIAEKTGVRAIAKYDGEYRVAAEETLTILVGNTRMEVSGENIDGLRADEAVFRYDRGYFVLGGGSDAATVAAIDKFEKEYLTGASNAYFVSEDAHFEIYGDYPADAPDLNDFDIYEFSLIYSSVEEKKVAEILQAYILRESGYLLECKEASQDENGIFLSIDSALESGEASIAARGRKITLSAGDSYGLSVAAASLARDLFANGEGEAGSQMPDEKTIEYERPALSVSLVAARVENESDIGFVLTLMEKLKAQDSDVIFLASADKNTAWDVEFDTPDGYKLLSMPREDGSAHLALCREGVITDSQYSDEQGAAVLSLISADNGEWRVIFAEDGNIDGSLLLNKCAAVICEDGIDSASLKRAFEMNCGAGDENASYIVYSAPNTVVLSGSATDESVTDGGFICVSQFEMLREYCLEFLRLEQTE